MATERQIEANRLNAARSTGPKSAGGKEKSRLNSFKHGMAGENLEVAEAMKLQFATRREEWSPEYRPKGKRGAWALDRLVAASFQIEQSEQSYRAALAEQSTRARLAWDVDRRADTALLMAKLGRQPGVVGARLEASWHGCDALVGAWAGLDSIAEWGEAQTSMALDLLGIDPALRDGRTPLDTPIGVDPLVHRHELIEDEIVRLADLRDETFAEIDDLQRETAESGASAFETKPAQLALRYERDAWRRYRDASRELRRPDPEPIAEAALEPDPEPEIDDESIAAALDEIRSSSRRARFGDTLARPSRSTALEDAEFIDFTIGHAVAPRS